MLKLQVVWSFTPSPCLSFACLSVYGICSLLNFSCLQFSCLQFSKCRKYMQQKMCHTTHICFKVFSRHIIALCEEEKAAKFIIHWKSSVSQSHLHFHIFRLEECLVMLLFGYETQQQLVFHVKLDRVNYTTVQNVCGQLEFFFYVSVFFYFLLNVQFI